MTRASIRNRFHCIAAFAVASAIPAPAWANHWFMGEPVRTGDSVQLAGIDRDSIGRDADNVLHVTLVSFAGSKKRSIKTIAQLNVDCAKRAFQQTRLSLERSDGERRTMLSNGPDWEEPNEALGAMLIDAACKQDFSSLNDLRDESPERYASRFARFKVWGRGSGHRES